MVKDVLEIKKRAAGGWGKWAVSFYRLKNMYSIKELLFWFGKCWKAEHKTLTCPDT